MSRGAFLPQQFCFVCDSVTLKGLSKKGFRVVRATICVKGRSSDVAAIQAFLRPDVWSSCKRWYGIWCNSLPASVECIRNCSGLPFFHKYCKLWLEKLYFPHSVATPEALCNPAEASFL